jgi:hypothetical protein
MNRKERARDGWVDGWMGREGKGREREVGMDGRKAWMDGRMDREKGRARGRKEGTGGWKDGECIDECEGE